MNEWMEKFNVPIFEWNFFPSFIQAPRTARQYWHIRPCFGTMDIDICTWCIFRTVNQWHAVRQSRFPQSSYIYYRVASHCCYDRFDYIHYGEKTATVQRIGCIRATTTRSRAVISWQIVSSFLLLEIEREKNQNSVYVFVVLHRKYGSAVSSDPSRTCSLSDVMVSNGMSHKNCDSWSRLVVHNSENVYWMDWKRIENDWISIWM